MTPWAEAEWASFQALHATGRMSPRALDARGAPLDFGAEARAYVERVLAARPAAVQREIERLSRALDGARGDTLVAVCAHAAEPEVARALDSLGSAEGAQLAVLVNAPERELSAEALGAAFERLAPIIRARGALALSHHAPDGAGMGGVRGALADAAVLSALRRGARDPLLVWADADQLAARRGYLARLRGRLCAQPALDLVYGRVLYGVDPRGALRVPGAAGCPELTLGDRWFRAHWDVMTTAQAADRRGARPDGASAAIRLSSLCAIGGLPYGAAQGEDNFLGQAVGALRGLATRALSPDPRHVFADGGAWVCTDPRRQLRALLAGRTPFETWRAEPWDTVRGPALDARALLDRAAETPALLQVDDLRAAVRGDRIAGRKVRERVLFHFARPFALVPALRRPKAVARLAARFGLALRSVEPLVIDWSSSPVIARAIALAR